MRGDIKIIRNDRDTVGDITRVDVDGRAGDARQGEVGQGGKRSSEGHDETLGAVRTGSISHAHVQTKAHTNVHGCDVFCAPTAHLERADVKETRKGRNGLFGVDGRCEGEGEGLEAGARVEDGENEVGGGSPCGTEGGFGADGEGFDIRGAGGGDMTGKGLERCGGGENDVGKDRGETECA